ncbi:hypothetical protein [Phenylobacterium sp.]|uniref:hypothetical protein n=1 Tax=Phenylobacterium sp. TaxID=1871053 RepID=UPI00289CBFD2|nr:hypothetical protein [Phenylobacterium sp.]
MANTPKKKLEQLREDQPVTPLARKPYLPPSHSSTRAHPFGAQSKAANYLQLLPYNVNSYTRYWMFHGDVFSKADKLLLEYLIALGFTEEEAVEKLPHAKEAVRQATPHKEAIHPSADFSSASASDSNLAAAQDGDPRFASIERYANRASGEDALTFYQRAWAAAPQPLYREDVDAHDPILAPAIQARCKYLNRQRKEDGLPLLRADDILPPRRPVPSGLAKTRESNRRRQATRRQKLQTPIIR